MTRKPDDSDGQYGPSDPDGEQRVESGQEAADFIAQQDERIARLEALIAPFNSFDLAVWLTLRNLAIDPETYSEASHGGAAVRVEYLSLQLLRNTFVDGNRLTPSREELDEIEGLIKDIVNSAIAERVTRSQQPKPEADEDDIGALSFSMHLGELLQRTPGYPHHQRTILRALFEPFAQSLRELLGFDVDAAIRVSEAIGTLFDRRYHERVRAFRDAYELLEKVVRARRKGKSAAIPEGLSEEVLRSWERLSNKDLHHAARHFAFASAMVAIGDNQAVTVADLSHASEVPEDIVAAYVSAFSMAFGEVSDEYRKPHPVHPLKARPILRHEDRYLCPIPDQLVWAVQPMLEAALKKDARQWHRYEDHRHDAVLSLAVAAMQRVMPAAEFRSHLKYPSPGGAAGEIAELDAFGQYDSCAFLIEAKAGGLRPVARRGVPAPFEDQVGGLLRDPHEQSLRARRFLFSTAEVSFQSADGRPFAVSTRSITRTFHVAVTLEPLGHITSHMSADSSFVADREDPAWLVSLLDLMAIGDCLEGYAPWLPHYITRRTRLLRQGFMISQDELDFFMYYLERGLYFDGVEDFGDATNVSLGTFTDPLDHYYFWKEGIRKTPAPRPSPRVDKAFLQFIQTLDDSGLPGRLNALLMLLDVGGASREQWIEGVSATRRRVKRDKQDHDFSAAGAPGSNQGITYVCTPRPNSFSSERLSAYIRSKRRASWVQEWIGIVESLGPPRKFYMVSRSTKGDSDPVA
jgi:hypothetical protein